MSQPATPGLFFDRQALARRRTWQILLLFPLSLLAVMVAFHAVYFLYTVFSMQWVFLENPLASPYRPARIVMIHGAALVMVIGAMVQAWRELSGGGVVVVRRFGGRLADPHAVSDAERRWINVVSEMAVAARIPVPGIYVLDNQNGINAFAAGHTLNDSVVAITRGGLDLLTRDELQGIAAHEIGHIVNGDSRLNMRIMILLAGVQLLPSTGKRIAEKSYQILEIGGKMDGSAVFGIIFGMAMWVLGSVALIFNRLIQVAVSRQREHLADASALQFCRYPQGLAQALQKIGGLSLGSRVCGPRSEEHQHLFLGQSSPFSLLDLFNTHPPLVHRITLLDPSFSGTFPKLVQGRWYGLNGSDAPHPQPTDEELELRKKGGKEGMALAASLCGASAILTGVHHFLMQSLAKQETARCLLYSLLITHSENREGIFDLLSRSLSAAQIENIQNMEQLLNKVNSPTQLALVRLATMALAGLTHADRTNLVATVRAMICLDGRIGLVEYSVEKVLHHTLLPEDFKIASSARASSFRKYTEPLTICLSLMARISGDSPQEAFGRAVIFLGRDRGWQIKPANACGLGAMDLALNELAVLDIEHLRALVKAIEATFPPGVPPSINAIWMFFGVISIFGQPIPASFWNLLETIHQATPRFYEEQPSCKPPLSTPR